MDAPLGPDPNPRFEKIDKAAMLAQCPLFSGLSHWELRSISQLMRLVEYRKDELVYREGGEAESFHVIVSGRFDAYVSSGDKRKVLAYLRRGDYFGEMSLLTDQPHSATIRALSDSLALEMKREDFKRTIEHNATISLELSRRLSSRLKITESRSRSLFKSDIVSVFGAPAAIDRSFFAVNLASSLFEETHQKTVLIDLALTSDEPTPCNPGAERISASRFRDIEKVSKEPLEKLLARHHAGFDTLCLVADTKDHSSDSALIPLLNHLAVDYRFIVLDLPSEPEEPVMKALSQSDSIFILTDSHMNSLAEAKEAIADIEQTLSFPPEKIVLVIQEAMFGARTTGALRLELFGKKRCFSISDDSAEPRADSEYARTVRHMARYLSGNLVGLALGSGAAFGLAHIGVLKVLEREKIPVDIVAGSSIGALIGSLYAVGCSAAEIEKAAREINLRLLASRLIDINLLPIRGLMHGKEVLRHFKKHLGNRTFEHCRTPLLVTGANLTTRHAMVFDSGSVAEAVRASIAIPAIIKPVFRQEDTIVDGGILNPLPVNVLHEAGANKVIAVNVFPSKKDLMEKRLMRQELKEKTRLAATEKGWLAQGWWNLRRLLARLFFPNLFDILMNTIQAMEAEIAEGEGAGADILMRPVVPNASWVDFFKADQFIRRGEEEAMKMLPKIKALVSQQNV